MFLSRVSRLEAWNARDDIAVTHQKSEPISIKVFRYFYNASIYLHEETLWASSSQVRKDQETSMDFQWLLQEGESGD
ncbi:hypothetical protein RRG08_057566 [Elysia crispata]|uniref:Uncharacterized protein n=1 Tax=Elysia crispata TaxID=231223 RepID=A0AAE0ZXC3_9GAST|nr:hypothetical protein RRG08_057566 [Elysia crispata]